MLGQPTHDVDRGMVCKNCGDGFRGNPMGQSLAGPFCTITCEENFHRPPRRTKPRTIEDYSYVVVCEACADEETSIAHTHRFGKGLKKDADRWALRHAGAHAKKGHSVMPTVHKWVDGDLVPLTEEMEEGE